MMRRLMASVSVALLAGVVLSAQQNPTFKSTTSLVLVDVTVLDKDGKPVPGLTANDFQVKLDGTLRPVRAVTYEQIAAPFDPQSLVPDVGPVNPAGAPTRVESVTAAPTSPRADRRRIIVILVDDLSMTPARGKSLFAAAARFVKNLQPTDLVGVTTSSQTATVNPTTDHVAVELQLPRMVGQLVDPRELPGPAVGLDEAIQVRSGDSQLLVDLILRDCFQGAQNVPTPDQISRSTATCPENVRTKTQAIGSIGEGIAERQVRAFTDAVNALKNVPGIKQLVVISDGLALPRRSSAAVGLEPLAKSAAGAGVQVSVLSDGSFSADVTATDHSLAGDNAVTPATGSIDAEVRRADTVWLQQGVQTMAEMTGGTFYNVIGNADRSFERVAQASSAVYELGVDAPEKSVPGKDFTLSVKVTRDGLTARANHHALVPEPKAPVPIETQLKDAIGNGTPLYGIPIAVGSSIRRGIGAAQVAVNLDVDIPGTTPGPVTLMFGLVDPIGVAQSGKKLLDPPTPGQDYHVTLAVPVASGNYKMRLAVADATGSVGSVETKVRAVLAPMGPFVASDLLTGWNVGNGPTQFLALEQLPPSATRMFSVIELYPNGSAPPPSDVRVTFSILTPDGMPVDDRDAIPTNVEGVLRAEAPFDLQLVPAGPYTIRATVKVAGTAVGTATTTVRLPGVGGLQ
jgi:VWFA-related protein